MFEFIVQWLRLAVKSLILVFTLLLEVLRGLDHWLLPSMKINYIQEEFLKIDRNLIRVKKIETNRKEELSYPVLLVHGISSSSDTWMKFFDHWNEVLNKADHPELARPGRLIIAPDLPGYGRSETDHVYNMEELASWLERLLDELQVEQVHFVGNSMGCQVGLAFARMFPNRIRSLSLTAPTFGINTQVIKPRGKRGSDPNILKSLQASQADNRVTWRSSISKMFSMAKFTWGFFHDAIYEPIPYNWAALRMFAQQGLFRYLVTCYYMFFKDRPFTKWNAGLIKCPVLVIRGQHDKVIREDHVREVLESLENAPVRKLRHIKKTAHGVEYSRPKDTCKLLFDFIDELDINTANRD